MKIDNVAKKYYIFEVFQLIWNISKSWVIFSVFIKIVSGLLPLLNIILMQQVIRNLIIFIQGNDQVLNTIFLLVVIQFILIVVQPVITSVSNIFNTIVEKKIDYHLEKEIASKAAVVPFYYFDNPKFHDHLERIHFSKGARFLSPINSLFNIFQNIISLGSLLLFLMNTYWLLALLCLITMIPVFYVENKYGVRKFLLMVRNTPVSRAAQYLSGLMANRYTASEIKLFNMKDFLLNKWSKLYLRMTQDEIKLLKKREINYLGSHLFTGAIYLMCSIIVIKFLKKKALHVDSFISIMQSVQESQKVFSDLSRNLTNINNEKLYIKDLFEFLQFEDDTYVNNQDKKQFPRLIEKGITVKDLSFTYPFSNKKILNNINFNIRPGERIAIVGENGSGKTTLLKCLMGLYPIDTGEVLYEGIPLQLIDQEQLYKSITVLFQDYMRYNLSVKENIALSDINNKEELNRLFDAMKKADVYDFVNSFKEGIDTVLGRVLIEGEDLSGGQWQKIAIARALYKGGELFILDEPTSALDPKAEIDVYQNFDKLVQHKTAIFISHRMASARMADKIIVMKDGNIIEFGSHSELMSLDSEYSRMYNMQSEWYYDSEVVQSV